jgi:hypothetical protein
MINVTQWIDETGFIEELTVKYVHPKGREFEITSAINKHGKEVGPLMNDEELEQFTSKVIAKIEDERLELGELEL